MTIIDATRPHPNGNHGPWMGQAYGPNGGIVTATITSMEMRDGIGRIDDPTLSPEDARNLRARLWAAAVNGGYGWPTNTITIERTETHPAWRTARHELSMLVAVLRATGATIGGAHDRFDGRVALDGTTRGPTWRMTPIDAVWDLGALR